MSSIFQLVYTSKRLPNCTDEEIEKILNSCKKNNAPQNITGLLLLAGDKFIQCLEGDKARVTAVYDKIKNDDRH